VEEICITSRREEPLIEGVPGVAKSTLARTFAPPGTLGQAHPVHPRPFTSDITGMRSRAGLPGPVVHPGPLFTQVLLADEINRAPARPRPALLEAPRRTGHRRRHHIALYEPFLC
jgi:MoxR-like ATPase